MIILDETQKDQVKGNYGQWKALDPIEIQGNLWILPEEVLEDNDYSSIFEILNYCEQREVLESELIIYNI